MERSILLIFILAIIGVGVFAGVGGLAATLNTGSKQMTYTTIEGECQIRVYDDPLYAEHWAKEVNPYNCKSYLTQEQAENIKADTHRVNIETRNMQFGVYSIFGVVALMLIVITIAVIRG